MSRCRLPGEDDVVRSSAGLAPEAPRAQRVVRGPAPPHAPDDPEQLRRQLHGRLEPGIPVAVALGLEGREPGAPRDGPRGPEGGLVERPPQEPAATLRDPRLPGKLPGLHPHNVEARQLPELAELGEP